ncbi:Pimeloyl-ACP methyl ester carboxylesterase [Ruminococcaceae bacterium YRB3002]|nr:Pimeloyl-ACP methyl ester carboxylesterase [Ruminococcaceae bacterium YRB3002]
MTFGFSYIGLIWLIMLLVPNAVWTKNQPKDYDKYVVNENKILLALERTGEFIVTPVALIFSDFNYKGWNFWCVVLILSFLCMVLYEIYWIRYFRSGKTMQDFYSGILGIPVAGATLPVVAFFLLGIYGGNIIMILASVILGIGHIGIHLMHRREVFGKKPKKHIAVRIILGILKAAVILILVLVFGTFSFIIGGRNVRQISRAFTFKDGINESAYITLGGQEQYILMTGKDVSNPVIITLHGGPGAPTTYVDYCYTDYLADDYTIVSWDQRGCGRSYYRNAGEDPLNESLTFGQEVEDLDALVDYVRDRFGKDKVIIMGHSYGSVLGSQYVLAHPEKVSAYIGIGQVTNEKDWYSETYSYESALAKARASGDDTSEMEAAYAVFAQDHSSLNIMNLRNYTSKYHPVENTSDVSTEAAILSPYVGVDDVRWYLLEMKAMYGDDEFSRLMDPLMEYMAGFNAFELDTVYQVPVFFISGGADWVCPFELTEEYLEVIAAPDKSVYLMEGCGHSPMSQEPEEFAAAVKEFLKSQGAGVDNG